MLGFSNATAGWQLYDVAGVKLATRGFYHQEALSAVICRVRITGLGPLNKPSEVRAMAGMCDQPRRVSRHSYVRRYKTTRGWACYQESRPWGGKHYCSTRAASLAELKRAGPSGS